MELTGAGLFFSALVAVLANDTGQLRLLACTPPPAEAAAANRSPPSAASAAPAASERT